MSILRSEKMGYYNLITPRESAWYVLNEIGESKMIHFIDMDPESNSTFGRPFASYIRRSEDLIVKINFIEEEIKNFKRKIIKSPNYNEYQKYMTDFLKEREKAENMFFDEIETEINEKFT